jgi:hypothetical protein
MQFVQASPLRASGNSRIERHLPAIETWLVILLAALLLWKGVLPGWKTLNTDFPNYYVVARLIREHYCLDRIYDWIWLQRIADRFGIGHQLVGFLGLTPFSSLPIIPLSWLPVLEAKRVWIVCNIALLTGSVLLLSRTTGLGSRRVWLIALCAVIPLRTSFLYGQMHLLVLTLLVVAYLCHRRGWEIGSGCCIAVAGALKIYPLFFCLYFLVKRRWKALSAALLVSVLCLLLSYAIAGKPAMNLYLFQQLPPTLQGESNDPFLPTLTSSSSLFHRIFLFEPELNPHPLVSSVRLYAIFYSLWQALLVSLVLFRLRPGFYADEREALEWSAFLTLLMFLSSTPASYQFVILIAAAVPTMSGLATMKKQIASLLFFVLYLAACNVRTLNPKYLGLGLITPLLYLKLWVGVALLLFYCTILKTPAPDKDVQSRGLRSALYFRTAIIAASLWFAGICTAWFHLRNIRVVSADRVTPRDDAYFRSHPLNTDNGLLYVAMLQDGFRVRRADTALSETYQSRSATDELSFATSPLGKDVWVEVASDTGSRLVHFILGVREPTTCQFGEAEYPSLSADGSSLAFLREDHGRGSLWIVDPHDCSPLGGGKGFAEKMTSPSYDVRTLGAGLSNSFLMSAIYQGRERIFVVSPGSPAQLLFDEKGAPNSPALSPDGKLLVVRKLVSRRWQLVSHDLSSGYEKQLTRGDCNAYTPSWKDGNTLLYATDCMRGVGLTALVSLKIDQ